VAGPSGPSGPTGPAGGNLGSSTRVSASNSNVIFNNIGATATVQVNCPGTIILGGGGTVTPVTGGVAMTASLPTQAGPAGAWQVQFTKVSGAPETATITVWALCSA
jgi:hypothetical protein